MPASFPLSTLLDNFDRADNASLGANWTEAANGKTNRAEISGNTCTTTGTGASSIAAYTGSGAPTGTEISCQYTVAAVTFPGTADQFGLAVTVVSNTTIGLHTELDLSTTDLVVSFWNDSTGVNFASATDTGFGQIQANDLLGLYVLDNGSSVLMQQWLGRGGSWHQVGAATASAAQYLAGPYYVGLRVKYATEHEDDFYGQIPAVSAGRLGAASFVGF